MQRRHLRREIVALTQSGQQALRDDDPRRSVPGAGRANLGRRARIALGRGCLAFKRLQFLRGALQSRLRRGQLREERRFGGGRLGSLGLGRRRGLGVFHGVARRRPVLALVGFGGDGRRGRNVTAGFSVSGRRHNRSRSGDRRGRFGLRDKLTPAEISGEA